MTIKITKIEDFKVPPNIPKARGMEVIGIVEEFDYVNGLENAYGDNIAKEEGIDEKTKDIIADAIKADEWYPYYYPKPPTMEATDVEGKYRQLTGFTTRSGHIKAKKKTMLMYLIKFKDAVDENGVMQSADFWRRAWRTKENVIEKFDFIKTPENRRNILKGAKESLDKSSYVKKDGEHLRRNISAVLVAQGISNPTDKWINDVRDYMGSSAVMTNADDSDVSSNEKLKDSVIVVTKTFGEIKDAKMDSQVLDDIEENIVKKKDEIIERLEDENRETHISVVGKTLGAAIEKADKIRDNKKQTLLNLYKIRFDNHEVIRDLVINHGFSLEDALKTFWKAQKPDEKKGEIYEFPKKPDEKKEK